MAQLFYPPASLRDQLGRYGRGAHECHSHYAMRIRTEIILRRCNLSSLGSSAGA